MRLRAAIGAAGIAVLAFAALWFVAPNDSPATPHPAVATSARPVPRGRAVTVVVDGTALGAIAYAVPHEPVVVAIEPVARALGWNLRRTSAGAELAYQGVRRAVRVGSRFVVDDGRETQFFEYPLSVRDGALMLALDDAAALFEVRVAERGNRIALASDRGSHEAVTIVEVARTPRPHVATPAPTPTPIPTPAGREAFLSDPAVVAFALERDGGFNLYRATVRAQGSAVRGVIVASGVRTVGTPLGTVAIGPPENHAAIGQTGDPLAGIVMRNAWFSGVDLYRTRAGFGTDVVAGHRGDDTSLLGFGRVTKDGSTATSVSFLTHGGRYQQTIVRRTTTHRLGWGEIAHEVIVGDHGAGAGLELRTNGRTYIDATTSYALGGLPLAAGDAPTSLSLSRRLSETSTLSGGLYTARQIPLSPFLGFATGWRGVSVATSLAKNATTLTLGYAGPRGNGQVFVQTGVSRVIGASGLLLFPRLVVAFDAANDAGATNGTIAVRGNRAGMNLEGGIASRGGRVGPLVGVTVPVSHHFALETALWPGTNRGSALRVALLAGIPARARRVPTGELWVRVARDGAPAPLRLHVDGELVRTFPGDDVKLLVPEGKHDVFVDTADARLGSPTRAVEIAASAPVALELPLWRERGVRGRVRFDAPAAVVPLDASLAGIAVKIVPGDIVAVTDADGIFVVPLQAIDPEARVEIDPDTVPRGFRGPEPLALPAEDAQLEIPLVPAQRIERRIFK